MKTSLLLLALQVTAEAAPKQRVDRLLTEEGKLVLQLADGDRCMLTDGRYARRKNGSGSPVEPASAEYVEVLMEDFRVTGYSVSGGPGDIPVENVSLDYGVLTLHLEGDRETRLPDGWYHVHKHGSTAFGVRAGRLVRVVGCTPL